MVQACRQGRMAFPVQGNTYLVQDCGRLRRQPKNPRMPNGKRLPFLQDVINLREYIPRNRSGSRFLGRRCRNRPVTDRNSELTREGSLGPHRGYEPC